MGGLRMSEENKRMYGGSARIYPDGLHARRTDERKWIIYDGTNHVRGIGTFPSEREANDWIALQNLMAANVGPEWGYVNYQP